MTATALGLAAGLPLSNHRGGFPAPSANDFFYDPIRVWGHTLRFKPAGIDLSINRVVLLEFLTAGLLCLLFAWAFRRPQARPRGVQNVVEVIVDFIRRQLVEDVLGSRGKRFVPYFVALFMFIWLGNLLEIIPGIEFPVNSRTGLPLALALISLVLFLYQGIKTNGAGHYFKEVLFPPGIPKVIYVVITPIEVISTFLLRPFTLFVRLAGNMISGHLLLGVMFAATDYLLFGFHYGKGITGIFAVGSFAGAVIFTGFELFVATLQAYIFTLLTGVYLAGALEPQH